MRTLVSVAAGAAILGLAASAAAQQLIVYPAKGQSSQQIQKDRGECESWATSNTGIDPNRISTAPVDTGPAVGGGERVTGAARGALGGLAIGAIAGDAGKGAGIGAVVGTMAGGRQARQNKASKQQQSQAKSQDQIDTWNRALSACLEARGYTVR